MKSKSLLSRFATLLLICFFMIGFQQMAEAQFKILNSTACTITLKVGQRVGCSTCNVSGLNVIPSGGTFVWNPIASCGPEAWLGFKFLVGFPGSSTSSGVSYNPDLGGGCGTDFIANCNGVPITATWFTNGSGTGGAKVILN